MQTKTGITCGQGLGDTVSDVIHFAGWYRLADAYENYTGRSCGCKERQEKLNQLNFMDFKVPGRS